MADSTSNITQITTAQSQKETTANANFDAASPSMMFGRMPTSTALTWNYYGGKMLVDGVVTSIANGTLSLTNGATNYIEATRAGVVSANTTGFTAGRIPLYQAVASGGAVTSYTDKRVLVFPVEGLLRIAIGSPQSYALTAEQALNQTIEVTGAQTAESDLIVPSIPRTYTVYANTSGFGVRVVNSGSPSAGVSIAVGMTAIVRCDGDRVIRVTADV